MSQNDLVIANQTFPATRADINSALQALGSLNSGPSEPSTLYANMLWYDTTYNILKMRSEADDAWIDVGTLDQSLNTFTPSGVSELTQGQRRRRKSHHKRQQCQRWKWGIGRVWVQIY